jgi:hypothetical protein
MGDTYKYFIDAAKAVINGDANGFTNSLKQIESIYKKSDKVLNSIYSKYMIGTNNGYQPTETQSAMENGEDAIKSLFTGDLELELNLKIDDNIKKLKTHFAKIAKK